MKILVFTTNENSISIMHDNTFLEKKKNTKREYVKLLALLIVTEFGFGL